MPTSKQHAKNAHHPQPGQQKLPSQWPPPLQGRQQQQQQWRGPEAFDGGDPRPHHHAVAHRRHPGPPKHRLHQSSIADMVQIEAGGGRGVETRTMASAYIMVGVLRLPFAVLCLPAGVLHLPLVALCLQVNVLRL